MKPDEILFFKRLLGDVPDGPRIEIGVFRGDTLKLIAMSDQPTIGVDSFQGMPEPGKHDGTEYPMGRLASDIKEVRSSVGSNVKLVKGFVPEVLCVLDEGPYAFAHLDIDHYEPTLLALNWLLPRMMTNGILCCDDWFPKRDFLAAKAINEVAETLPLTGVYHKKAFWKI